MVRLQRQDDGYRSYHDCYDYYYISCTDNYLHLEGLVWQVLR